MFVRFDHASDPEPHEASAHRWPAKVARLVKLHRMGLPVPAGVAFLGALPDALVEPVRALAARGAVIVRGAMPLEDGVSRAGAGLSRSVPHCHDLAAVREATAEIQAAADDPWLARYAVGDAAGPVSLARPATAAVIVQRQISPRWLCVVSVPPATAPGTPGGAPPPYVECHDGHGDADPFEALGAGHTPAFAGPLSAWPDDAREAVVELVDAVRRRWEDPAPHGLDLEVVVGEFAAWIVQLRPLTTEPWPAWPAFARAMAEDEARGELPALDGLLELDAEHNPEPLSAAHTSLIRWLDAKRPDSGGLSVVAGWLYVRTKVRDLAASEADAPPVASQVAADPVATLARLHHTLLPRARTRLAEHRASLERADLPALADSLRPALRLFGDMIALYLRELVPARAGLRPEDAVTGASPSTLRDKAEVLDVLPETWDVASPTLDERLQPEDLARIASPSAPLPDTPGAAARQLTEWDDHLFALGMAPLRASYLAIGRALGWPAGRIFGLGVDELAAVARGSLDEDEAAARADGRLTRQRRQATLRPPPRLWFGWPAPVLAGGRLRGMAIGASCEGPLAVRESLGDLLRRRPPPGAIVCLPALTAQGAVALASLEITAVCTEHGGVMSHAAIMARELGLSAIIGCRGCTDLPDGTAARLDATSGRLELAGLR